VFFDSPGIIGIRFKREHDSACAYQLGSEHADDADMRANIIKD
jgi:hypothetical protein